MPVNHYSRQTSEIIFFSKRWIF